MNIRTRIWFIFSASLSRPLKPKIHHRPNPVLPTLHQVPIDWLKFSLSPFSGLVDLIHPLSFSLDLVLVQSLDFC